MAATAAMFPPPNTRRSCASAARRPIHQKPMAQSAAPTSTTRSRQATRRSRGRRRRGTSSATSTNQGITSTARALSFISRPSVSISSSTFTSFVVATTRSSRIRATIGPPRSCARIRTSITRSLVGSASSSRSLRARRTGPSMRASVGNRANAARNGGGPVSASDLDQRAPSERPAAIDAPRSRRPSGQAACTSRSRAARRRPKYARGSAATAIAGTMATSAVPVTKTCRARSATTPTPIEPARTATGDTASTRLREPERGELTVARCRRHSGAARAAGRAR